MNLETVSSCDIGSYGPAVGFQELIGEESSILLVGRVIQLMKYALSFLKERFISPRQEPLYLHASLCDDMIKR